MNKAIYMDHHATTPVDPRVLEEMLPYFTEEFGNASSSTHAFGWRAKEAVEKARSRVAALIGAEPEEVVFTSGATESDNIAIKGVAHRYRDKGNHIITSPTEHKAVLETCSSLEKQGFEITYLPVDKYGLVDPEDVRRAITERTVLVSLMHVNSEIGTVHPIREIGAITREKGVLFHTDAVQGLGKLPIDVNEMNIDLLSLSGHKIYGPKGIGGLYVRRRSPRVRLTPVIDGGGQERNFRSGTLNVPGIVGLGKACEICQGEMEEESKRLTALRERLLTGITEYLDEVYLNGHPTLRHPGNLNLSFDFVEGESLLMSIKDVALSSGSACTSENLKGSYVLLAIGVPEERAHTSIRFGLGRWNTEEEVDYVAEKIVEAVNRLRELSPLYEMHKQGIKLDEVAWSDDHAH